MEQPNDKRTEIEWTSYLACAYAEGFCEGDEATDIERIEAFSFIAINKLHHTLQGWYGRSIRQLTENFLLNGDGTINWDMVDEMLEMNQYNT